MKNEKWKYNKIKCQISNDVKYLCNLYTKDINVSYTVKNIANTLKD